MNADGVGVMTTDELTPICDVLEQHGLFFRWCARPGCWYLHNKGGDVIHGPFHAIDRDTAVAAASQFVRNLLGGAA